MLKFWNPWTGHALKHVLQKFVGLVFAYVFCRLVVFNKVSGNFIEEPAGLAFNIAGHPAPLAA